MSTAAKLTLGGTIVSAIGIVIFVHRQQKIDQAVRELQDWPKSWYILLTVHAAHACRRDTRYGTTKDQKRTSGRFRDATAVGGAIQKAAEC